MWNSIVFLCFLLAAAGGCSQSRTSPALGPPPDERPSGWPKDWAKYLGQTVTLEGTAGNAKLGALLLGDADAIWIDGLDEWPEGFYSGGDRGKRLRVTGEVVRRDDLPVFFKKPGESPRAGIPVQSEAEFEEAKWRFLLRNAKWTVLE
jgi:hypothetical protein